MEELSKIVTKFNLNKDPTKQISIIGKLTTKYGDNVAARTLVQLKRNVEKKTTPKLMSVVNQLRNEQVTYWLKNDKSVLEVFNLLKLGDDGYTALRSQKLQVLDDYIQKFNVKISGDESLVSVMAKGFGGESNLVSLLATAKTDSETVTKAKALETALLVKWKNENLPPLSLWSRLKFGDNVDNALSSGKLRVFYKYVIQNYPSSEKSVVKRLAAKYREVEVAKALVTAKGQRTTKDIATKLQSQQLEVWVNHGKSADDVFTSLKIKNEELFLTSWKMETLPKFIKLFNSKQTNPQDKTNLFRVVRTYFGGDRDFARTATRALDMSNPQIRSAAHEYETALFNRWFASKTQPENIYGRFFNVEEASAGTLEKAIVSRYTRYYDQKMAPPQVYTILGAPSLINLGLWSNITQQTPFWHDEAIYRINSVCYLHFLFVIIFL